MMQARVVAVALSLAGWSAVASADQLSGKVEWKTRANVAPAQAVVYAEGLDRAAAHASERAAAEAPRPASILHKNKTFVPHVIAVPAGSTVTFPNDDPIFHNAFSRSAPEPFDMGLYRSGDTRQRAFAAAGAYHVFCNIHPQMSAFLVVAPTPYVAVAAPDGAWRLEVPPGRYRVTVLSERAGAVSMEVTVSGATTAGNLVLDESAFVATQHLNKFGKPYPKDAYKTQ